MVSSLDSSRDMVIHSKLDQFYYMTKAEELTLLLDQCEGVKYQLDAMMNRMDLTYSEVFNRWRHDARLLNSYLMRKSDENPK